MNFDYSDDQKILQQSIRNLFKKKFSITHSRNFMEQGGVIDELKSALAEQGLLGISYENPENINEGLVYSVLASFEAGRVLLPYPLLESHITSYVLTKYGDKASAEHSDALISGEKIYTYGWKTKSAVLNNEELDAFFTFVPFAEQADYMMVEIPVDGKSQFTVLDLNNDAISIRKINSMDQTYPLFEVRAEKYLMQVSETVYVDQDNALAKELNQIAVLLIGAEAIGASEEILNMTVEYTKERTQFGQPIGKFQAVKHHAADMYLLLESLKALLKYASWVFASGQTEKFSVTNHMFKSYISESTNELMDKSVQVHGGVGFTWESDVHMFYKRCRRIAVMHGDAYDHREKLFVNIMNLHKDFEANKADLVKTN